MLRLALASLLVHSGFMGFTASLPVALAQAGVPDPEIGLIVGSAALVQLPAALFIGVFLDRVGGIRVFTLGAASYLVGCAILLLPGVEPGGSILPFMVARLAQGIGAASTISASLALVPRLAPAHRLGLAFALVGSTRNLTLVALPAISLAILAATSLRGVALAIAGLVAIGLALALVRPLPLRTDSGAGHAAAPEKAARRQLGFAFRRSWASLVAIQVLFVPYFGFVNSYLPQRAEAAGADVGLYFFAFGVALMGSRVPIGWLADRVRSILLIVTGLALTSAAIVLLALPPTTPLLVLAGAMNGGGIGLTTTPLLVELARRSSHADRGSAFSLWPAGFALGQVIGSIGTAPLIGTLGFESTILLALGGLVVAATIALLDRGLRQRPGAVLEPGLPSPIT